jgi:hypothetical protein
LPKGRLAHGTVTRMALPRGTAPKHSERKGKEKGRKKEGKRKGKGK